MFCSPISMIVLFRQIRSSRFNEPESAPSSPCTTVSARPLADFIKTLLTDLPVVQQGSEIQVTPGMPRQMVGVTPLALAR